jgi:predicted DCC family thiol-disulfide oxidoreductase YuxK
MGFFSPKLIADFYMLDRPVILFDGECNLCNWAVNFVLHKDRRKIFLFSLDQSESGREILLELGLKNREVETVYLLENDEVYSKSTAVLRILGKLPFPWKLMVAFIIIPKCIRDVVYDVIARNRYLWFGKAGSCGIPSEREKSRFLS